MLGVPPDVTPRLCLGEWLFLSKRHHNWANNWCGDISSCFFLFSRKDQERKWLDKLGEMARYN